MHTAPSPYAAFENHFECQLKSFNNLVRALNENDGVMAAHYEVDVAEELGRIVGDCLNKVENLKRYLHSRSVAAMNDPCTDPDVVAKRMLLMLEEARNALTACQTLSDVAADMGHPLPQSDAMVAELATVDEIVAEINGTWVSDPETERISRQHHEQGLAKDAKEVFNALHVANPGESGGGSSGLETSS